MRQKPPMHVLQIRCGDLTRALGEMIRTHGNGDRAGSFGTEQEREARERMNDALYHLLELFTS